MTFTMLPITLGCSALVLVETPVCMPIILVAPSYVWPRQSSKLKEPSEQDIFNCVKISFAIGFFNLRKA